MKIKITHKTEVNGTEYTEKFEMSYMDNGATETFLYMAGCILLLTLVILITGLYAKPDKSNLEPNTTFSPAQHEL